MASCSMKWSSRLHGSPCGRDAAMGFLGGNCSPVTVTRKSCFLGKTAVTVARDFRIATECR
jgi:hypothetical protein